MNDGAGSCPGVLDDLTRFVETHGRIGSAVRGDGAIAILENAISQRIGTRYALAVSSGTAALAVALKAVGVGPSGEVVTSTYDWGSAAAAVLSLGARPVFADVDPSTALIDPESVRALVSGRTTAVVVTHLFGNPAPVPAVLSVTGPLGIPVVEDCAQALGASLGGSAIGSLATAGCFSFGTGKAVDAGEGGMLVTNEAAVYERAVAASQHPFRQRLSGLTETNDVAPNLRAHPASAALAVVRLEALGSVVDDGRTGTEALLGLLRGVEGVVPVAVAAGGEPSYHRFALTVEDGFDRHERIGKLRRRGVAAAAGPVKIPLHHRVPLAGAQAPCPAAVRRCLLQEVVVNPRRLRLGAAEGGGVSTQPLALRWPDGS